MAWTWVNGEYYSEVFASDRGLLYGDGCFTTMRLRRKADRYWYPDLWEYHQKRLHETCQALGISLPDVLADHVEKVLASAVIDALSDSDFAVLRITVTRGIGGHGYAPERDAAPTIVLSLGSFPVHYLEWQHRGVKADFASFRLGIQPVLAGLKTLNRLEQVILKQELLQRPEVHELIALDMEGHVTEATAANIFWRKGETWYTPCLSRAGVDGVMRQAVMMRNPEIQEVRVAPDVLLDADEMFMCNALMELVPIFQIADYQLPNVQLYPDGVETVLTREASE